MTEDRTVVLSPNESPIIAATAERLLSAGWRIHLGDSPVDAVVFDPGLLDGSYHGDPAEQFLLMVEGILPDLRNSEDGGASIVVIGSRDQLGWAGRAAEAAAAGALASVTRSLALALAPHGVSVNLVAGAHASDEPRALLPDAVTPADIAETVAFLVDPRSRYVTGQLLFCTGGSHLLSSMSA
jgi:NAD(P)-dependent dehydrogenase (short-subunit alcohol dehydrogenase family)